MALHAEHLLEDLATYAIAALCRGDIAADRLDFRTGIVRAAGTAGTPHHLVVGDVVADIKHFLIGEAIGSKKTLVGFNFHGAGEEDVGNAELLVAQSH